MSISSHRGPLTRRPFTRTSMRGGRCMERATGGRRWRVLCLCCRCGVGVCGISAEAEALGALGKWHVHLPLHRRRGAVSRLLREACDRVAQAVMALVALVAVLAALRVRHREALARACCPWPLHLEAAAERGCLY